ncbi:MAG: helix-hairpin-helix domain-containing protein [Actinobacteria bacterium]|nr:helix-hairpin-helix domain-containing protein [Actinomycetota bacterium]
MTRWPCADPSTLHGGVAETAHPRTPRVWNRYVDCSCGGAGSASWRPSSVGSRSTSGVSAPRLVNINRASVAELDQLPGVGPSTARAIVEHRERHGPYATVDDLLAVRGIGPAKLVEMRAMVSVS